MCACAFFTLNTEHLSWVDGIFQQDVSHVVWDGMTSIFRVLPCPSYSTDLNPFKHLWVELDGIFTLEPFLHTFQQLWDIMQILVTSYQELKPVSACLTAGNVRILAAGHDVTKS